MLNLTFSFGRNTTRCCEKLLTCTRKTASSQLSLPPRNRTEINEQES